MDTITADEAGLPRASNKNAKKSELLSKNAVGRFVLEDLEILKSSAENVRIVALKLLDAHFPETLHREILESVGLYLALSARKRRRSPDFRRKILRANENRCCVCGCDLRFGNRLAGIEAANIMWHTGAGPDEESNGLALCTLHH